MDDEIVTIESLKAELAADSGFTDAATQCGLYVRSFRGNFDRSEYEALNKTCASTPPSQFVGF